MRSQDQTGAAASWYRKFSLLFVAACAACGFSFTALAQDIGEEDVDEDVVEEIVVKGFRGSLEASLSIKRRENGVVDAIVAEEIADFPDLNLAESIQRIPGVSINRMSGEGRQITVRGLGGDFNRIRINGMEVQNTSGGTDSSGGSNRGRSFDFNTFASELFNRIEVRKTASASVEEGAIGATVDLFTARPFDYDEGLTVATSVQGGYNDLSDEINPRFAGLVGYQNDAGTFGALMSVAYSDRKILEEGFSTVRWQDGTFRSVDGVNCGANPTDPGCASIDTNSLIYHPRIPRYGRLTHEQTRLGITGGLQFRPSDTTEILIEGMYSDWDATRDEEFLEVFFRSQEGNIDVFNPTINQSMNILDSGTFTIDPLSNGTHPVRSEHRYDELNTTFTQFTGTLEHQFNDGLIGRIMAGTSKSEQDVPVQTTILYDATAQVVGYTYDFRQSHRTPSIDFGSLDVTDPNQFAFTEVRDRPQYVENNFTTLVGDLDYEFSDGLTLRGGLSWKKFEFDTTEYRRENTNGSRICDAGFYDCDLDDDGVNDIPGAPLTPDMVTQVTGFGSGLGGSGYDTTWVSANVNAATSLIDLYSVPGTAQAGNIRSVEEEDVGGWVELDFATEWGSIPVRGDIGVRYVETTTTSTGLVDGTAVTVERKYDDTLPSMNLVFEFHEDFLTRLSIAEVMARPSLGDLTPGGSLDSFNGPPFSYDAGNPGLDPYRATNYDLAFEWYFAESSMISFDYFYKKVDSFFQTSGSVIVPYSQSGLPTDLPPASSPLEVLLSSGADPEVELSQTQNGGDATLDGFEIIYQQPFSFLPGGWANFGFTGNYTKVNSDEILGFSENAYNATLYYENEVFSGRVSAAYRDPYEERAPNSAGRDARGYDSTTAIDMAFAYNLSETWAVTLEVLNLTDEFENQLFDAADLVYVHHHTGTEFILGVRWAPN